MVIRNWTILNRQQITRFPQKGFLIAQLRAGTLITVIDDKRQERTEGEFWIVPAGSFMSVETGDDLAVLQTIITTDVKNHRVDRSRPHHR